ncbi:MAG: hypothetical protein ACRDZW_06320 [Acidimicrobiales bacterium]
MARTPSCVWRISTELVVALDDRLGPPLDTYVNGSQVWLADNGPDQVTLEWRLHPVAGFRRPAGLATDEVLATVALALATGADDQIDPALLWDGLEAFPAYADEPEPPALRAAVTAALGLAPDAAGLVDHATIGDRWERSGGGVSIVEALLAQLRA